MCIRNRSTISAPYMYDAKGSTSTQMKIAIVKMCIRDRGRTFAVRRLERASFFLPKIPVNPFSCCKNDG